MKLAQLSNTFGTINPPSQLPAGVRGEAGINIILNNISTLLFSAAALAFVIMFLWGAVQMILSAGDKEAVSKARGKITWAIIGIFLMALSYFIFEVLQDLTGFRIFT
jgi:hypothetical protein